MKICLTTIARSLLVAAVLVLSPMISQRVEATMQHDEPNPPNQDFLALLKRIIGDGDLRNIGRFERVLNVRTSLEPFFITGRNSERRLSRVNVVPDTEQEPFAQPLFRFSFNIQDSTPPDGAPGRTIATMVLPAMNRIGCITREDIIREFGPIESETWGTPGAGSVLSFMVAETSGYRTEVGANIRQNEPCVAQIVVRQSSR